MKIPGESCPYCSLKYCTHRCDNCDEHFNWPTYLNTGILNWNPKSQRKYPIDDDGNIHNNCMGGGTRDRKFHHPGLRKAAKEEYERRYEKQHDLHEYLKNKLVLKGEYWYKYHDGKYVGIHSRATKEELTSWEPKT